MNSRHHPSHALFPGRGAEALRGFSSGRAIAPRPELTTPGSPETRGLPWVHRSSAAATGFPGHVAGSGSYHPPRRSSPAVSGRGKALEQAGTHFPTSSWLGWLRSRPPGTASGRAIAVGPFQDDPACRRPRISPWLPKGDGSSRSDRSSPGDTDRASVITRRIQSGLSSVSIVNQNEAFSPANVRDFIACVDRMGPPKKPETSVVEKERIILTVTAIRRYSPCGSTLKVGGTVRLCRPHGVTMVTPEGFFCFSGVLDGVSEPRDTRHEYTLER